MKQRLRIASLNIANYDDHAHWQVRRQMIIDELAVLQPDVIALQEVRYNSRHETTIYSHLNSAEQILAGLQHRGLYLSATVSTQRSMHYRALADGPFWEGLSVISSVPVIETGKRQFSHLHNSFDMNKRIIQHVLLNWADREVCLLHTHYTYDMLGLKQNIAETLMVYRLIAALPVLLMGDMNTMPEAAEFSLLRDKQFTDVWHHMHPHQQGCTYPAVNPIQRIDYMWANPVVNPMVQNISQWAIQPNEQGIHCSDHIGLMITLER